MTAFLAELGGKLADRWLAALVLPGMLWALTFAAAVHLGQGDALHAGLLPEWLDQLAARPAARAPGTVVLAAVASLVGSAGLGLLASSLGTLVERAWSARGHGPATAWILVRRQRRWEAARANLRRAIGKAAELEARADVPAAARRRARLRVLRLDRTRRRAWERRPEHTTRIGDRLAATGDRAAELYGIGQLDLVWPRLWSVLPDPMRTEIATARGAYSASARLFAWAALYLTISPIWWPAALIAAGTSIGGVLRARPAAQLLAALIDTAMDLHLRDLATALGLPVADEPRAVGEAIIAALTAPSSS